MPATRGPAAAGAIHRDVTTDCFEEAYYGLLGANLLMWETQEMLYTKDLETVAAD